MRDARPIFMAALATLTLGSLLATGGYAWYLRSERYRNFCAAGLSHSLGLPAEIGSVRPCSRRAREFRDIRVWLPQRRGEAAFCERAILMYTPGSDPEAYELDLRGGRSEISTRTWLREDYRLVLESGLRPGFDPDGPRRVVFSGMDLVFARHRFRAVLNDANGVVSFDDPHCGRAMLTCQEFNGHRPAQPVTLHGEFSPRPVGIRLDRVELAVPELPLRVVGLENLTGLGLVSGSFSGRLIYRESDSGQELTLSGKAFQIPLAECTAAFFSLPWRGMAPEVELAELTFVNGFPRRVRFRGTLTGVVLGDVLSTWGLAAIGGDLVVRVHAADLSSDGIDYLVASGRCEGLSLERVSEALGWGRMTGLARLVIDDLTINHNQLASLDAEISVEPPDDQPNWVERELLSQVLHRTLGVSLPSFLPERFEYLRLGLRLEVRDEVLYVFGTHGPRQKAILSVKLGDQELPVLLEPEQPFDLQPALDDLRSRLARHLAERLNGAAAVMPRSDRAVTGPAPEGLTDLEPWPVTSTPSE